MRKGLWVWGCVLETIPSETPDVNGKTYCSLETAADYLGAENLVYMNSMRAISAIDDKYFGYIKQYKNISIIFLDVLKRSL